MAVSGSPATRAIPVFEKLSSMKLSPIEYKSQTGPWEFAAYDQASDLHRNFVAGRSGVEVRKAMLVVVHTDDDSKES